MSGGVSASVMLGWFQSFYGGRGTGTSSAQISANSGTGTVTSPPPIIYAPTAPWNSSTAPSQKQLVSSALDGVSLFNPKAQSINLQGASGDYKNLFALYSGLNSLYAIATAASAKSVTTLQLAQYNRAFAAGMTQLNQYLGQTSFSAFKLSAGVVQSSQTSSETTPQQQSSYATVALNTTGNSSAPVPAFEGNVSFDVTVQVGNTSKDIPIDLDNMGSTPRTIGNVVSYLNSQMKAAGSITSFSSIRTAAKPDTIKVGAKTVTVSAGEASWALQVNTNPFETVSFSASDSAPAIYVGEITGNQSSSTGPTGATIAADATNQLVKIDAGGNLTSPNPGSLAVPGQMFADNLGTGVNSIQATAVAPDGSVYVLANVNEEASGDAPSGNQDVALMKYDSAGQLLFSTDLGSANTASGLSLAISPNGDQVAVAGEVTGSTIANDVVNDPTGTNSFVTVFDSEGDQVWTQQNDGLTPNQANGVAFAANGDVVLTGQAQTTTALQGPQGPSNSYLQVYSATGTQVSSTKIATGGSNTSAGVAVDGNMAYVAGVQNGDAVVTEYNISVPSAPTLVASRDLGNLAGGNVVGISVQNGQVYVAGNTRNASLSAGTVTSAASGTGLNAFAATLSPGLAPTSSDAIAYYGGTGDTRATGMTVSGGDVWLTGTVTGNLPGAPAIGSQDGFITALNPTTGSVDYAQRLTGQDGKAAPTSIAVASTGASILDQLGLPEGVVDGPVSNLVTSNTSVKAGDSFRISANGESPVTITIKASDTFASLATEIAQATGFAANVITSPGPNNSTALEIQPANLGATIKLLNGPAGKDALTELGLAPGVITKTTSKNHVTVTAASSTPIYGLGLPNTLDLSSTADIKNAQIQLAGAISVVESAYQNMSNAATPPAVLALQKAQAAGGSGVPAYLSSQISNYQAALTRLTAGQTGTTSVSSLL